MRQLLPIALLVALMLALGGAPGPAAAAVTPATGRGLEDALSALQNEPLYAEQGGPLSAAAADRVRVAIRGADAGSLHLAALTADTVDAVGSAENVGSRLIDGLGRRSGTYAVITPGTIVAASDQVQGASALARAAAQDNRGKGAEAVLIDFVGRVGEARRSGSGAGATRPAGGDPGGGGGGGLLGVLAVLAGGVGLLAFLRRRKARKQQAQEVGDLRLAARDDLVALGDDVRAIDIDVEMPDADPRAREHLGSALELYEKAERQHDLAKTPADFEPIGTQIAEGRFHLQAAKAILAGHEPPERRPSCFFDPRHGPSTRDVEWAPAGGQPRAVPACEADALRVEEGVDPATREITVGGRSIPYYDAPGAFRPYVGGYYSGFGGPAFGGLLPGLLFGSMLGGAFGGGFFDADDASASGGFDGGGGGFGGGDFSGGGGDFGGGGFGGGDFGGGGGFGGGDF